MPGANETPHSIATGPPGRGRPGRSGGAGTVGPRIQDLSPRHTATSSNTPRISAASRSTSPSSTQREHPDSKNTPRTVYVKFQAPVSCQVGGKTAARVAEWAVQAQGPQGRVLRIVHEPGSSLRNPESRLQRHLLRDRQADQEEEQEEVASRRHGDRLDLQLAAHLPQLHQRRDPVLSQPVLVVCTGLELPALLHGGLSGARSAEGLAGPLAVAVRGEVRRAEVAEGVRGGGPVVVQRVARVEGVARVETRIRWWSAAGRRGTPAWSRRRSCLAATGTGVEATSVRIGPLAFEQ